MFYSPYYVYQITLWYGTAVTCYLVRVGQENGYLYRLSKMIFNMDNEVLTKQLEELDERMSRKPLLDFRFRSTLNSKKLLLSPSGPFEHFSQIRK